RAMETAQPLASALGLEIQVAPEIGEVQFGDWTGQSIADLNRQKPWQQWNTFRSGTRIPNGELMIQIQARMAAFTQRLREEFPGQTIALVSHGDPLRALIAYCLGIPLDFLLRFEVDPASVSIISIGDDAPRVLCVNDRSATRPRERA